ncbi:MAG: D-alanyl-D-alanine carboxypeptidase [Deltaproteobacteria bacterium]|nr:D-alanyl-D-alanine carboxypeptidase [Deltaproteobacteria bacterium]
MRRFTPRRVLALTLALAPACGDDDGRGSEDAATDGASASAGTTGGEASDASSSAGDTASASTGASGDATETSAETGDTSDTETTGEPTPDPGDPFAPAPELPPLPEDVLEDLRQTIDGILDGPSVAGTTQSVQIVDLDSGQLLYERAPDLPLKPASNTKLITTATGLDTLGPDHRYVAEVYATAAPDDQGVIDGDLVLVGHHDPTWSDWIYVDPGFPLDQLARRVEALGVTAVAGALRVQGEFLWQGDNFNSYDAATHRAAAAARWVDALQARGVVTGPATTASAFAPPDGAQLLTSWGSPALATCVYPINVSSHNEFADISARHLGYTLAGESSYAASELELLSWLASIGVDTGPLALHDGSGLSHDNRLTARAIVQALAAMDRSEGGEAWVRSFAVADVRGTLASRMQHPDTAGRFYGKTGTLTGVIATSGVLYHRHDGRRYLLSILMNEVADASAARAVQDEVVIAVAGDLRGWATRPAPPVLQRVTSDAPGVAAIEWQEPAGADGYVVWLSADGRVWPREQARLVPAGAQHRAGQLPWDDPELKAAYVRVSARDSATGAESDPSDVYAARPNGGALSGRLLIVDGDDRWQADAGISNSRGAGVTFVVDHARALGGRAHDSAANEAVVDGLVTLDDYAGVIWSLGEESTEHATLSDVEQQLARSYLERGGGRMLVSGAELGWDLVEMGSPEDAAFFEQVLRAMYLGDDAETYALEPAAGAPGELGALPLMQFYTPGAMWANYPDRLAPGTGAVALLEYVGGLGGAAAVGYAGEYRVVTMGVPFESVDNEPDRAALMAAVLMFLGL